jgi:membrane-associated phospholipid phosphatase
MKDLQRGMGWPYVGFGFIFCLISYFYFDKSIARMIYAWNMPEILQKGMQCVTFLGEGMIYVVLLPLLVLFFRFIRINPLWARRYFFLWACVILPGALTTVLKALFGRVRPPLWFSEGMYGFYGPHWSHDYFSFPSGHATTVVALALGLYILWPRHWFFWVLGTILILLTRLLLLQHYLSDVIVGALLSWIVVRYYTVYYADKFD